MSWDNSVVIAFIIGAVGAAIAAFSTGFLKKAGEDFYLWLKNKIYRVHSVMPKPDVVIKAEPKIPEILVSSKSDDHADSIASHVRVSKVTFDEVVSAIESAPPMQKERVANEYKGIKVNWTGEYFIGNITQEGMADLSLSARGSTYIYSIRFSVPQKEYPELVVLKKGAKINVVGEISSATEFTIYLNNVQLHFPS